ncbi:hypothetical protein D3C75_902880 [compost metagenome]
MVTPEEFSLSVASKSSLVAIGMSSSMETVKLVLAVLPSASATTTLTVKGVVLSSVPALACLTGWNRVMV